MVHRLFIVWLLVTGLCAGDAVFTVDLDRTLRSGADRVAGINLNYMRDLDANRGTCVRSLDQVLRDLGTAWLRYPGGEKSDFHLFAPPPYTRPEPQVLGWYAKTPGQRMDFDAYVAHCRAVGAEPHVVVGCDNQERTGRTWDQWLEHAVAWVRHANVVKKYGVKRWEIGNENWHNKTAPPAEMARIVVRFAQAMKAVDPAIQVGASGSGDWWWKVFLPIAAPHLDFLTVSVYNCWQWKSYGHLPAHPDVDLLGEARTALKAIDQHAPAADRQRLRVVVAETNSKDYSKDGWPGTNTMGHALVTFLSLGAMIAEPRIVAAMVWNTRWMKDEEAGQSQWYALAGDNRVLPTGWAVGLWGAHLHERLVGVEGGTPLVAAFASAAAPSATQGRRLTVWIVNKGLEPVAGVRVGLRQRDVFRSVSVSCYAGEGPDDAEPRWKPVLDAPPLKDGGIAGFACPGVSITVLTFGP